VSTSACFAQSLQLLKLLLCAGELCLWHYYSQIMADVNQLLHGTACLQVLAAAAALTHDTLACDCNPAPLLLLLFTKHLTHLQTCLNSSRTSTGFGVLAPTLPSSSVTATCTRCSGISGAIWETSSRLKLDRKSCKVRKQAGTHV
jgi:hypothetical protein